MKKLAITLTICLMFGMSIAQAQEMVILDPAAVEYDSPEVITESNIEGLDFVIEEERFNEFFENPIGFIEGKFDRELLKKNAAAPTGVKFTCSKGFLKAVYDENGNLVRTKQRYQDIIVPANIRYQLLKDHKGWMMVSNKYTAKGKGNKIDKEVYKIKLVKLNGDEVKHIKIIPGEMPDERIAEGQ